MIRCRCRLHPREAHDLILAPTVLPSSAASPSRGGPRTVREEAAPACLRHPDGHPIHSALSGTSPPGPPRVTFQLFARTRERPMTETDTPRTTSLDRRTMLRGAAVGGAA